MDLSRCSCDKAGFCPVFRRDMDSKNHHWCKSTTKEKRINYYQQNVGSYKENILDEISNRFNFPRSYSIPINMNEVEIITFHFNASKSKRLIETYYEFNFFLRNLKDYITCYEIVFDDRQPEIKNSKIIKATLEKNCMWQKESLMNIGIKEAKKKGKKYIIWVDHDLVFSNPNWLIESINSLKNGFNFLQPFNKVNYLDKELKKVFIISKGRVYVKKTSDNKLSRNVKGAPGAVWASRVEDLDKIMPLPNSFLGSGDEFLAQGLFHDDDWANHSHHFNYEKRVEQMVERHIKKTQSHNFKVDYIDNTCYHLWHGDFSNRQYTTRYDIVKKHNVDVINDLFVNDDGLLEFVGDKSKEFSKALLNYFVSRKEDG